MKSVFRSLQALNIEKATVSVKKEARDGMGVAQAKTYREAKKNTCSLEAMVNSGTCEACR